MRKSTVCRISGLTSLTLAVAIFGWMALAGPANAEVRTAMNPSRSGDLVKTIPISKQPWQETRSVMSIGPNQLGSLSPGEVVEAASDMELTICIRPNPLHPGEGQPCVGNYYDFDPNVKVKLVIADSQTQTSPTRTIDISPTLDYTCTEQPGHRTRHCVQPVPWSQKTVDQSVIDLCGGSCHVNLLVSVYDRKAGNGQMVVVGSSDDNKRIKQGRSQLSAAVHSSEAEARSPKTMTTKSLVTKRPKVVAKGANHKPAVIYSQKITGARAGDQYLVEARPVLKNNGLPYPTHASYTTVISTTKKGTNHNNKIAERIGPVSVDNGFTCTQNSSGHKSPCGSVKTGVVSTDSSKSFYINLVVGQEARGIAPQYRKWKPSDRTKMLKKGFMRVRKYEGTMSCETCALTRGFSSYSPTKQPSDPRIKKLVSDLSEFGLTEGAYSCTLRRAAPRLVCDWKSSGSFGQGASYDCQMRAFYGGSWDIKPCKEAIGAQLWALLGQRGDTPLSAGTCDEISGNRLKCNWSANHTTPLWCKGDAIYDLDKHTWKIDPCLPLRDL